MNIFNRVKYFVNLIINSKKTQSTKLEEDELKGSFPEVLLTPKVIQSGLTGLILSGKETKQFNITYDALREHKSSEHIDDKTLYIYCGNLCVIFIYTVIFIYLRTV